MSAVLPLFPLGSVLFPGLVLPLKVFEERYRALVRHLMDLPDGTPRVFGVVAIRQGWEVQEPPLSGPVVWYDLGCTAELRQVTAHPDGRFDLVTVGRQRFEITRRLANGTAYPQAEIRYLPELPGDPEAVDRLAPRVLATFRSYLRLLRADAAEVGEQLPDDPHVLSHLVAAASALTVADRQELLARPDTATRLRAELALLQREIGLLRQLSAVPASLGELPARPGVN